MTLKRMAAFPGVVVVAVIAAQGPAGPEAQNTANDRVLQMLKEERPYHAVPAELFEQLGWALPDGGSTVKALADAARGGAFDPRKLESASAETLGYRAKWHVVRYKVYGLDWDIPGLHLTPINPPRNLPTVAIINGGSANWYEFFIDPLNAPGLGQYLAQRVPVLLITIPGNYRHGGWTETEFGKRIPGYLLDRDVAPEEARIRHSVYTFRVVTNGVMRLIEAATRGPVVVVGHSTGGEIQFILKDSKLEDRLQGFSLGWGTGGPAALSKMREYRGKRTAEDYPAIWDLNPRPARTYSSTGYLGPLNPVWDSTMTRLEVATRWMTLENTRRPQFKQTLQNIEHNSADNLRDHVAGQIRQALDGNKLGVKPEEVINDLFTTMRAPVTGYRKMIWTVAASDDGHWGKDPAKARELQVANEFRKANPDAPIRVLLFDLPMTHYGHVERPRQLAGGLVAALTWLTQP